MGQTRRLVAYFRPFLNTMTNIVQNSTIKLLIVCLGFQTCDHRMVDVDKSTEPSFWSLFTLMSSRVFHPVFQESLKFYLFFAANPLCYGHFLP